jgi:threonine dehydratase
VAEEALLAGVRTSIESAHLLTEPSGAAALAAARDRRDDVRGKKVVLVLSGANITPPVLRRALEGPPLLLQEP